MSEWGVHFHRGGGKFRLEAPLPSQVGICPLPVLFSPAPMFPCPLRGGMFRGKSRPFWRGTNNLSKEGQVTDVYLLEADKNTRRQHWLLGDLLFRARADSLSSRAVPVLGHDVLSSVRSEHEALPPRHTGNVSAPKGKRKDTYRVIVRRRVVDAVLVRRGRPFPWKVVVFEGGDSLLVFLLS